MKNGCSHIRAKRKSRGRIWTHRSEVKSVMCNAAFPWLEKERPVSVHQATALAERQDEAPRHGLPEQREDRIGKRDPSPPWLGWCIAGGGGG